MKSIELFKNGQLDDALEAAIQSVKKAPTDINARSAFAELLCFAGDLERADKQLDAMARVDPGAAVGVSMFRHLVRAEKARFEFYSENRVPEFIEQPSEELQLRLAAHIALRAGDNAEAATKLAEAERLRKAVSGSCNEEPFEDLRDLDDLLGSVLEVMTSNGKYYWVPFELITSISFEQVEFTRDLLWRPMEIEVKGDLEGRVYAPAMYYSTSKSEDAKVRVGQATDWDDSHEGMVFGVGQKMLLVGEEAQPFLQVTDIRINGA
ncbi:MAG: type VI secretion system accessory protein TagJ [Planctomycetaceae bacterium]